MKEDISYINNFYATEMSANESFRFDICCNCVFQTVYLKNLFSCKHLFDMIPQI